ncbi:MAG: rRNA maturation RNase YbeY [Rhodobacteraceae bacterium]|nr:rRNA maturation RNase YbeY [Alphaproteobacteria bacterium]MBT8477203.1 rRNA maturation RNase YbeY [Alphaproteobacteria bacterium]NNF73036.1 rRNA maturation RNase YbeY [Paracoccaceae bacterium]NNK66776.1 rRNA maturation RNase YbeY [Paracoccaceae bacterium]
MTVEIVLEDARWAGLAALADKACDATLSHLGLSPKAWDISLLACDDARIATLNAEFRDKPQPTNVLSWPAQNRAPAAPGQVPARPDPGPDPELGDIAIAFDTCAREATVAGVAFDDHVTHLLVHATLHLLGYDHIDDADASIMEQTEAEILATLGVANPY